MGSVLELGSSPALGRHHGEEDEGERMEEEEWNEEEEAKRENVRQDEEEQDLYALALAYHRTHEHLRAAWTLKDCVGPKARWLRGYAKYLVRRVADWEVLRARVALGADEIGFVTGGREACTRGEWRATRSQRQGYREPFCDRTTRRHGDLGTGLRRARRISALPVRLPSSQLEHRPKLTCFCLFSKSMLLLALPPLAPSPFGARDPAPTPAAVDLRLSAMDLLVSSVKLEPYNWSAWLKLAACIDGPEEVNSPFAFRWQNCPLIVK